jgi:K+/H+ antiporter YhaU regulatory subunit KhtT
VLAVRDADGTFTTNPDPETILRCHHVIIAVGTETDLQRLVALVNPAATR